MITGEKTVSAETLLNSLKWRYAVKKFDPTKKLNDETWAALQEALVLSASSFGLQPWKFVVVTTQSIKDKLPEHSWGQTQAADCSHLVVICRKDSIDEAYVDHYLQAIATARGVTVESLQSYGGMMKGFINSPSDKAEWMTKQCYIALGSLLSSAAILGVDACPMEGFDSKAYDKILGLEALGCRSVVVCPLGYRAKDDHYADLAKVRFDAKEVVIAL
ncbi:MAG: NAD(P)H-dependent oxidoreductase [Candidatus Obscuribacter sp.]|nr:NAD(P)H-dependent oxidoreductase [Candidatus Obscuribacter sp.]MBP6591474.1 NAD(P)H-dependent oxidoreductase [Candidatus Obscuribacter sp.]MBP7575100.1 NAD(P)H-dependent oxidoreductase [Candidatus Obscuribacter sp.]